MWGTWGCAAQAEWTAEVQKKLGEFMAQEAKPEPAPAAPAAATPAQPSSLARKKRDTPAPAQMALAQQSSLKRLGSMGALVEEEEEKEGGESEGRAAEATKPEPASTSAEEAPGKEEKAEEDKAAVLKGLHSAIRWCATRHQHTRGLCV